MIGQPARVRVALDDEIPVKFGTFALQVERPTDPDVSPFEIDLAGGIVAAGAGGVVFGSATTEHYPAVRIELWTDRPPEAAPETVTADDSSDDGSNDGWDDIGEAKLDSAEQTVVRLRSDFGDWTPGLLELFEPGPYRVRAYVRGRNAAIARAGDDREPRHFHGVERWLVRIWREPRSG